MRVCLNVPPSLILSDERLMMHLGILKVGSVLKEKGIPVDHLDLSGVKNYTAVIKTYIADNDTLIFGITATSPQIPASVALVKAIKEKRPEAKVILGGSHVTLVNAAFRKEVAKGISGRATRAFQKLDGLFDTMIAGDGELAMLHTLENPNLKFIDADDPKSDLFLNSTSLNALPWPARDLVDVPSYKYTIDGIRAITMILQLGCPFGCGFCGGRESPFLRRVRLRDTENAIAEMRHIYETYGLRGIMFYDDELNVNPQMIPLMHGIARLGKELGIEWKLRGFVKSELFTAEQASVMYEAGFREILIGLESGSPLILKNINKRATKEDNTRCVELARDAGLRVKALMSMGHPGESEQTVRETEEWILAMKPDSFDLTRITVYPGTPYFDHAVPHATQDGVWIYTINGSNLYSREVDFTTNFLYYKGDRGDRMGLNQFFTFTDFLSAEDLGQLRTETETRLREKLGQPFQDDAPAIQFEHSMGMGLPEHILRSSS